MASMRFASLRDRLVALIVLAALPTLGLALYTYTAQRRQAAQEGREAALRFAGGLVRAHEQRLGEARRLLVTLAAQPETRAGDPTACGVRYAALAPGVPRHDDARRRGGGRRDHVQRRAARPAA